MLTFLRKLRKSLINSGATRKYILYAIGEIILVVLGILIALQINNWNERQSALKKERILLLEVYDALKTDSLAIISTKEIANQVFSTYESIYKIQQKVWPVDSLGNTNYFRRVLVQTTILDTNYPDLATEVIDAKVKNQVLNYFQAIERWRFVVTQYNRFIEDKFRPFLRQEQLLNYGAHHSQDLEGIQLINRAELLKRIDEPGIQQMFFEATQKTQNISNNIQILNQYESLKNAIEIALQ